jgi:Cu/Ag efflux protein CusF
VKTRMLKWAAAMLMLVALIALPSCSKDIQGEEKETVLQTPTGATIIDTFNIDATVAAVDPATRKVTLTQPDGRKTTFKAGPNVDISNLKPGDKVSATLTEELVVALSTGGEPLSVGASDTVALATDANDRAGLVADAVEMTAKVTNVDTKHHKVTLQLPDGQTKTFKVHSKKVDLSKVKPGDDVTVRYAEAVAINVRKT